ncbi:hypothetical protein GCM10023187_08330 [Nibrella viscosa]|uniref:Uncharacterized protein n=1 Tax=Nibrella viscosa TaxID=1084524 RepID=A0ABP8JZR7_9BACT
MPKPNEKANKTPRAARPISPYHMAGCGFFAGSAAETGFDVDGEEMDRMGTLAFRGVGLAGFGLAI